MRFWFWAFVLAWALACTGAGAPIPPEQPVPATPSEPEPDRAEHEHRGREVEEQAFVGQADPCADWEHPGTTAFTIPFDGKDETAVVHVPKGAGPRRMVFVLHGGDGNGPQMIKQTEIIPISEREGFVVVAPSGAYLEDISQNKWNGGKYEHEGLRNDVGYLDALARAVGKATCAEKTLAIGFSNGGQMANRWMCEGDAVDAMVTASGTLLVDPGQCKPRKRPVLGFIGTEDKNFRSAPIEGGLSAPDTVHGFWAPHNGCAAETRDIRKGDTTCSEFSGCGAATVLCVIDGFPHAFPRGQVGKKRCDSDASEEGWSWFRTAVP